MVFIETINTGQVIFNGQKIKIIDVKIIDETSLHLKNEKGQEYCLICEQTVVDKVRFDSVSSLFLYIKQKCIEGYAFEYMSVVNKTSGFLKANSCFKTKVFKISLWKKIVLKIKNNLCLQ